MYKQGMPMPRSKSRNNCLRLFSAEKPLLFDRAMEARRRLMDSDAKGMPTVTAE